MQFYGLTIVNANGEVVSDISLGSAITPFNRTAMIKSNKNNNNEVVTWVFADEEHPILLEVGRNEYNKFEKDEPVEMQVSTSYSYSSAYVLDYNTHSFTPSVVSGSTVAGDSAEDFVINIDTDESTYSKTVTLFSNANFGFSVKAKLVFVKA